MPKNNQPSEEYNPRWFVWTVVFLVVTGVSLVAFITLSDSGSDGYQEVTIGRSVRSSGMSR
ncbi:MAG: hypothetical protein JNN11_00795 [Candidatus Doudnabacteria bacterium]|nr:hypothetical protein [Candidatus Doudnabacteria bacterium]